MKRVHSEALKVQSDETLAKCWDALNIWDWPSWLPEPEPRPQSGLGSERFKIQRWIRKKIGLEKCLEATERRINERDA